MKMFPKAEMEASKQLRVKNKVVPLYPCAEAGEHCPVHILDMYITRLPSEAKEDIIILLSTS